MLYLNTPKINNSQGLSQHWLLSHFALNCIFASQHSSLCCLWRLQSPRQKTTSESRFFPTMWDLGIKLRLLGLATVIFAHWPISPAWTFFFLRWTWWNTHVIMWSQNLYNGGRRIRSSRSVSTTGQLEASLGYRTNDNHKRILTLSKRKYKLL